MNLAIIFAASRVTAWFSERPLWTRVQRWLMGTVLAALGIKLALTERR